MKKIEDYNTNNFVMKISSPSELWNARVGLMLHGLTGDETSMWVFTNKLTEDWLLIAPRALYPSKSSELGGYSWIEKSVNRWPLFEDFLPAVNTLQSDLQEMAADFPMVDFSQLAVFGFSQGAAAAFVFSMIYHTEVAKLGMLSGFLPDNGEEHIPSSNQTNLSIFIGHGSQDHIVPVTRAEKGTKKLRRAGFFPQLCITDVGHRLGADCFTAFSRFMNNQ